MVALTAHHARCGHQNVLLLMRAQWRVRRHSTQRGRSFGGGGDVAELMKAHHAMMTRTIRKRLRSSTARYLLSCSAQARLFRPPPLPARQVYVRSGTPGAVLGCPGSPLAHFHTDMDETFQVRGLCCRSGAFPPACAPAPLLPPWWRRRAGLKCVIKRAVGQR